LGYKFNPRTLSFTKTGIISIKTQPEGVDVYLDGNLLGEKTPMNINELLPGVYNVKLEIQDYYPWISEIKVEPRKVARLEKIILFPKRPNIKQLNQERISHFWVDNNSGHIFYFSQESNTLYESNLDGEQFKEIGSLPQDFTYPPKKLKVSPDKDKLFIYNPHQIAIFYLKNAIGLPYVQLPVLLKYPRQQIVELFWYSDSYHMVLVSERNIEALEAAADTEPVNLVSLNKRITEASYDSEKDVLYFIDSQRSATGAFYDNAYKLDLSNKASAIKGLINIKQNAKE
jgi:hypothetical protein